MYRSLDLSAAVVVSSEPHSLVLPLNHTPESSSSSSSLSSKVSVQDDKLRWLDAFLGKTFFDSCEAHPLRRNELNQYCINCNQSACGFCVSSGPHNHHQILQIHRYGFRDAVYLRDMKKFIDCSEIQCYKSKGQLVICLNLFQHNGSPSYNDEASCNICSGKLTHPDKYRYCSISCKVKAVLEKPVDSIPPFICILNPKSYETQEETSKPQSLRKRRRKGTPYRAPLF